MTTLTLQPTLTDAGLQAAFDASVNGIKLEITHIAFGDSGYDIVTNDNGLSTLTSLGNERDRAEVRGGGQVSSHQYQLSFAVQSSNEYFVREVGFFLEDGTLFGVWSNSQKPLMQKAQGVDLVMGLDIVLSALPANSLTITPSQSPLEIIFDNQFAVIATAQISAMAREVYLFLNPSANPFAQQSESVEGVLSDAFNQMTQILTA